MAFIFLATALLLLAVHGAQLTDARVKGTKILGVLSNADSAAVLEVRYEALSYEDAEDVCQQNEGQLAVIKSVEDLAFVNVTLFYPGAVESTPSNIPVYVPSFYWIGLKKWPDNKWRYADGTPGSHGSAPMFSQPLQSKERNYECGGIRMTENYDVKRERGNCKEKLPFLCAYAGKPCVPDLPRSDSEDYKSAEDLGYNCKSRHLSQLQQVPNNCNCTDEDYEIGYDDYRLRIDASVDHLSCTENVKWSSAFCVSGCAVPTAPTDAVLVNPEPHVFTDGSYITFFCPGYFQVSRTVIPTNVHQVKCKANMSLGDEIEKIKCIPTDSQRINKNIKLLLVEPGKDYPLHCEFLGFRQIPNPDSIIWVKDNEILDIPTNEKGEGKASAPGNVLYKTYAANGGRLQIHNLSPKSQGTYACFGLFRNTLLPGNVFMLSTDESDISLATSICPVEHSLLVGLVLLKFILL